MDKINIQRASGFPVQKKTFDFMQEAYGSCLEHLCRTYGDNVILYGVELVGSNRTAGAVVINGEILPFEASPDDAKVLIDETTETAEYKGGEIMPSYYTRRAKCAATGTINLADLKRVSTHVMHSPTEWAHVGYLNGCDSPGTYNMQARIDEAGKCLIVGPVELGKVSENTGILAIAQLPNGIKPRVKQTIQITPYLYTKTANVLTATTSNLFPFPAFGFVDTDGKIYVDNNIEGLGYIVDKFGWINAIIDL